MKNTRRKHSDSFKTEVVLEALKERKTLAELAQEYQLLPAQISSWKAEFQSITLDQCQCLAFSKSSTDQLPEK
jgi:transposase-like protein